MEINKKTRKKGSEEQAHTIICPNNLTCLPATRQKKGAK